MSKLLVGFSGTPLESPRELIGDGLTSRRCEGISDELRVQSLVLESEKTRVAILTFDLLAVDFEEADEVRSAIGSLGIHPENVLIAASHTHAGPPAIDFGEVKKSRDLAREIVDKAEQVVEESVRTLSPASCRAGFTEFVNNVNRRQRTWLIRTKLGINLNGPVDHQLSSVLFRTSSAEVLLLSYGCHPVICKKVPLASADYVYGSRKLADSRGIRAVFFLCGALGDVNPYDRDRQLPLGGTVVDNAIDFGARMTEKALQSLHSEGSCEGLSSASSMVEVRLPKLKGGFQNRRLLVQALKVGPLTLIAFPGEMFAQTGLDIRKSSTRNVITVSCANGYVGYVPPRKEYARGGYEVNYAPRVFGFRVPVGLAETLQTEGERLIERLVPA